MKNFHEEKETGGSSFIVIKLYETLDKHVLKPILRIVKKKIKSFRKIGIHESPLKATELC